MTELTGSYLETRGGGLSNSATSDSRLAIVREYARRIAATRSPEDAQRLASELCARIVTLRRNQQHALLHDEQLDHSPVESSQP